MKRRSFLQQAGLSVAGGGVALISAGPHSEAADALDQRDSPKRVLVTSAHTDLAQAIADALAVNYVVHLTASSEVATRHSFTKTELGDDNTVDTLVRGMDTIVHLAQPPDDARDEDQIDCLTRGTYNLLRSAASEGVRHVLYLSSLELLTGYDEDFEVTEDWRPLPSDDAHVLSHYLGEFTCREFAREGRVGVVVLRLGKIVHAGQLAGEPFNPMWIDQRDAVQAVSKAMKARLSGTGPLARGWSVFHIHSGSPRARFTSERAKREFGYEPQFLQAGLDGV